MNQQCPVCHEPVPPGSALAPFCSADCKRDEAPASSTKAIQADRAVLQRAQPPRAALVVYHRDGTNVVMLTAGESVKIGRARPAQTIIADASLSREHARIMFDGDKITIVDLRSTNGTFVNGVQLEPNKPTVVAPGAEVLLGTVLASVQRLAREEAKPAGLLGHDKLIEHLREEILRAREFRRHVSLLFVGSIKPGAQVDSFAPDVQQLLRPAVDRAAIYSLGLLEVLLPERELKDALAFAHKLLSKRRDLSIGVASYPGSAANVDDLVDAAHEAHNSVRKNGGIASAKATERKHDDKGDIIKATPRMIELWDNVAKFAQKSLPVLILGEPGSGKEVVARALHTKGPRGKAKMMALNCGALQATIIEGELFGTVPGAYTSAVDRAGPFEEANGGTVFLDEIGELPLGMQAKLLRLLEEKIVTRLGSTKEVRVDFRLVSATNRDLRAMIDKGEFRADLFGRLNGVELHVPPLRERVDEILPLAKLFLSRTDEGETIDGFDAEAEQALTTYPWPGNVRELRNAIERAAAIASPPLIKLADLPEPVRRSVGDGAQGTAVHNRFDPHETANDDDHAMTMKRLEARRLYEALKLAKWKPQDAADALHMARRTFDYKLKKFGIRRQPDGTYCEPTFDDDSDNSE